MASCPSVLRRLFRKRLPSPHHSNRIRGVSTTCTIPPGKTRHAPRFDHDTAYSYSTTFASADIPQRRQGGAAYLFGRRPFPPTLNVVGLRVSIVQHGQKER